MVYTKIQWNGVVVSVPNDVLAYAREVLSIWRHLDPDEVMEQLDAHLESAWPDTSEDVRDCAIYLAYQ